MWPFKKKRKSVGRIEEGVYRGIGKEPPPPPPPTMADKVREIQKKAKVKGIYPKSSFNKVYRSIKKEIYRTAKKSEGTSIFSTWDESQPPLARQTRVQDHALMRDIEKKFTSQGFTVERKINSSNSIHRLTISWKKEVE